MVASQQELKAVLAAAWNRLSEADQKSFKAYQGILAVRQVMARPEEVHLPPDMAPRAVSGGASPC